MKVFPQGPQTQASRSKTPMKPPKCLVKLVPGIPPGIVDLMVA